MNNIYRKYLVIIMILLIGTFVFCGCSINTNNTIKDNEDNIEKSTTEDGTINQEDLLQDNKGNEKGEELPDFILSETEKEIVYLDPFGDKVTLPKNPKRVVSLYKSYYDLWYEAGGQAIATVSSSSDVLPDGVEGLGKMSNLSPEKILALQPDLLIMSSSMTSQAALKDLLIENNIPYLYINYYVYQDYINNFDLMSRLIGSSSDNEEKLKEIKDKINTTIQEVQDKESPKVLIMFLTTKSVTCENSTGSTGNMVDLLGGTNIVDSIKIEGKSRVDFSMEAIAAGDPDIIFIKTMGDIDACLDKMNSDIKSNEAWSAMRAVKEGKVYLLDKDLFLSKPNERFPEAFEILADYMYE